MSDGLRLIKKGDSNWDLYSNPLGKVVAIPNAIGKERGSNASHFGDCEHLRRLMDAGYMEFSGFTEDGLSFMNGLHSKYLFNKNYGLDFSRGAA
jgi:hypothetical protein